MDKTALPMDQLFSNRLVQHLPAFWRPLMAPERLQETSWQLEGLSRCCAMVPWSLDQHTPWKNHMILLCWEWREIPFAHVVVLWNMMIGTQLNTS
jgi:hypothetical protein